MLLPQRWLRYYSVAATLLTTLLWVPVQVSFICSTLNHTVTGSRGFTGHMFMTAPSLTLDPPPLLPPEEQQNNSPLIYEGRNLEEEQNGDAPSFQGHFGVPEWTSIKVETITRRGVPGCNDLIDV